MTNKELMRLIGESVTNWEGECYQIYVDGYDIKVSIDGPTLYFRSMENELIYSMSNTEPEFIAENWKDWLNCKPLRLKM